MFHALIHILRDSVWQGLEFLLALITLIVALVKHKNNNAS